MARAALILTLLLGSSVLSGCVPVAIGAGGAIAADTIAEDRGKDLF
jgi:predicted small secreted protein